MSRSWAVLLLAGAFEVGYALAVGGSHGFTRPLWSLAAAVFFLMTLAALSVALRGIDVGVGYAVWAGIGSVGAALLGPVLFDDSLTPQRAAWLAVIVAGVVWLKARRPAGRGRGAIHDRVTLAGRPVTRAKHSARKVAGCLNRSWRPPPRPPPPVTPRGCSPLLPWSC
ncbi:multidrug efflux SMR transporter [Nocardioides sp. W3-2-3]|nr:multidrug efflux SMR transporter [Nocardioides convexus]